MHLRFQKSIDPVNNDPRCAASLEAASRNVLGDDNVQMIDRASMGGEDFSAYLVRVPGASHGIARRPSQLIAKVQRYLGDHDTVGADDVVAEPLEGEARGPVDADAVAAGDDPGRQVQEPVVGYPPAKNAKQDLVID